MREKKKCRKYLCISICTLALGCIAICFTGVVAEISQKEENDIPLYLTGGAFWMGFILTYLFTALSSVHRKRDDGQKKRKDHRELPGFFCFFTSKEAIVMDLLMIVSVVGIAIELGAGVENSFIVLGTLFMLFFSVHMHAILNGKNYRYLKSCKNSYF